MQTLFQRLSFILLSVVIVLPLRADIIPDTLFQETYQAYLNACANNDSSEIFYELSQKMLDHFRESDDLASYYSIKMNEVLYETETDHAYKAVRLANQMLDEMEADGFKDFSMVYAALGTIFQSRGNYKMAEHYYTIAYRDCDKSDVRNPMALQSRLAFLLMLTSPAKAHYWNEMYVTASHDNPFYRQVYLFIQAMVDFAVGNRPATAYDINEYKKYHNSHDELDDFGMGTIKVLELAIAGRYKEAIDSIDYANNDLDAIAIYDLLIKLHEMEGDYVSALKIAKDRSNKVDSLNADLMFDNLNHINTEAGLASARQKASEVRERALLITLVLAVTIIILLCFLGYHFFHSRKKLKEKNEQLASALSMAEEADKMKTEFVRSVSHEIRTPLNAISGFSELLWDPTVEVSEEERTDLVKRVKENVDAITLIVDEMLQMAEQGSSGFYPKTGTVFLNSFLSQIVYTFQQKVSSGVELRYTTQVINRLSILTNRDGVEKIVGHLLQNAIKFTSHGSIVLNCAQEGNVVQISVTDTGTGIPQEKQERIFEQFYKVDSFRQGIGLGLTVSKKIAQKLGGDLVLDTSYTDGSRFVLTLPATNY